MRHEQVAEWLFHPLSLDTFLDEIWGKSHHIVRRNDAAYFADLFGARALEDFLEYSRPEPSGVRLVKGKDKKELPSYRLGNGALDMVALRNDFASGYTIVLNGLERYVGPVATLARGLEADLNYETQVNAYITPPGSQGFLPHYDDHDVIVLQVEGSKRWHIYEQDGDVPACELHQREIFVGDDLQPATQLTMTAGDLLYVPRGRIHAAETLEDVSIHLTLGVHPPNTLELAKSALDTLANREDRVIERLPPRYLNDPDRRALLADRIRDLLARIDDRAIGEAIGAIEDGLVRRGRCRTAGRLIDDVLGGDRITTDSKVVKSEPLYARVMAIDGGVALQFAHSLVKAGANHRDAMLFLSRSRGTFRVGDIPGIAADEQIMLARKLLIDGFLIQVPDA